MSEAPLHEDSDRDVVVSVQDGNYRMVEVARVTPPVGSGVGTTAQGSSAGDTGGKR